MKALLLILLPLMAFELCYGQSYQPFVVEGAHWEMNEYRCEGCNSGEPYPQSSYTHYFKLEGDTIINSFPYKKLYHSLNGTTQYSSQYTSHSCEPWIYVAALKENTLLKQVFIVGSLGAPCSITSNTDSLLFDFSLIAGDTSKMFMASPIAGIGCNDSSFIVDSVKIDSFHTYNTHTGWTWYARTTQFLNPLYITGTTGYKMYEGIGPSFGLFGTPDPSFEGVYSTSLTSYCVGHDSICGYGCLITAIADVSPQGQIHIYPNPFYGQLNIYTEELEPVTIALYNFVGQQILKQSFEGATPINTAQIADGFYFYELSNNKGIIRTGKAIKE
jgi:hypothetical protein